MRNEEVTILKYSKIIVMDSAGKLLTYPIRQLEFYFYACDVLNGISFSF